MALPSYDCCEKHHTEGKSHTERGPEQKRERAHADGNLAGWLRNTFLKAYEKVLEGLVKNTTLALSRRACVYRLPTVGIALEMECQLLHIALSVSMPANRTGAVTEKRLHIPLLTDSDSPEGQFNLGMAAVDVCYEFFD